MKYRIFSREWCESDKYNVRVEKEERGLMMIGWIFREEQSIFRFTVSSDEKSDLKRETRRRSLESQERKVRREKSRSSFADCEDGAVPTEGCAISLQFYPFPPLQQRSCRTFNIVLPDLKYETAPQLEPSCQPSSLVPSRPVVEPILLMKKRRASGERNLLAR